MLSGHAFDYTFRGYYLPCAFMQIGRSPTRLPILKAIPDGRPETVARMQRIGIPAAEASSIFSEKMAGSLTARRTAAVAHALEGCEPRSPYDAWDGFIMHTLGRHYAYSDFVAMETALIHRPPAYDHGVFDIYLAMSPQWRASGTIVRRAMRLIAPQLMQLPDANTGVKAAMPFWTQLGLGYLKAGARRAGLLASPVNGVPGTTQGSWSDYDVLFRTDPEFVARLDALTRSELIADTGLFDMKRLAAKIGEHRDGKIKFKRVLWQLLTVESWLRQFGYSGVGDD